MIHKTKIELTWIGKKDRPVCVRTRTGRPKLEPLIQLENPEKSYHAAHCVAEYDVFDTGLIVWDNESHPRGQATSSHTPWSELRTEWRKRNE